MVSLKLIVSTALGICLAMVMLYGFAFIVSLFDHQADHRWVAPCDASVWHPDFTQDMKARCRGLKTT